MGEDKEQKEKTEIQLTAPKHKTNRLEELKSTLIVAAVTVAAILLINGMLHPVRVSGTSMYPTLQNGELLRCISADADEIEAGDIIVFRENGKPLIKRVVGVPGETLTVMDGYIYADDVLRDSSTLPMMEDPGVLADGITLGENEYFCVGDNRNDSCDCRYFGPITKDQITLIVKSKLFGGEVEQNKKEKENIWIQKHSEQAP